MKHPCSTHLQVAAVARWMHAMKSPASLRQPTSAKSTIRASSFAETVHACSPEPGAPTSRHIQPRCMHASNDSSAPAWPASSCSAPPAPASPAQSTCRLSNIRRQGQDYKAGSCSGPPAPASPAQPTSRLSNTRKSGSGLRPAAARPCLLSLHSPRNQAWHHQGRRFVGVDVQASSCRGCVPCTYYAGSAMPAWLHQTPRWC